MDVLLAVMPFADIGRPSIGVALLSAEAKRCGLSAAVEYFNITLAEEIGDEIYETIANGFPPESLLGEWFFSDILFGDQIPHYSDYFSKILRLGSSNARLKEALLSARGRGRRFIETCVESIVERQPKVVGFTTTFHQTCACLAVARRLKELQSPPIIIFGGANCEAEMGLQLVKSFDWVDYASLGEGERIFSRFLSDIYQGRQPTGLPGLATKQDAVATAPEMVANLDDLPIPDYEDYFERQQISGLLSRPKPHLVMETSRGCWWGMKQHCTFCGLNGKTMNFRSKSQVRAIAEIRELVERFGIKQIECVDNILDMKYIPTFFDTLKQSDLQLELFYEVKANLRYDQLAAMRSGGVRAIQPGIESFSSHVLQLMRKGCTALQNIQLLRWCEELAIQVGWNILTGFPGELASDYAQMAELIALVTHLQPPATCSPLRLDRFSPYFARPAEFGIAKVRPSAAYYYVFPLSRRELSNLAYFFDFDYMDGREPLDYTARLGRQVRCWIESRSAECNRPQLDAEFTQSGITVRDTRAVNVAPIHHLTGTAAEVYARCDSVQGEAFLIRRFPPSYRDEVEKSIEKLKSAKLLIEQDNHLLSLAVFRNRECSPEVMKQNADKQFEPAKAPELLRCVV
jgi:ribosomal peptide maturation radical SAM protein 1